MKQKLLPLPLGASAPLGSEVPFWRQYGFRRRLDGAVLLSGVLLALAGCWLGVHHDPVAVGLEPAGFRLGGDVLDVVGGGRYSGDTAVVIVRSGQRVRAAAAGRVRGEPMTGRCDYFEGTSEERCSFTLGGSTFMAHDLLRRDSWLRTYDNGARVALRLTRPDHPTPVPVPIGWAGRRDDPGQTLCQAVSLFC